MGKIYPLIAICGMDGSGKTTLAKKYAQILQTVTHHGHRYSMSATTVNLSGRGGYLLSPLIIIAYADFIYTYFFKYKSLLKKQPLICDRYFYDKIARLIYYKILPFWGARIMLKIIPKPYITHILIEPFVHKEEITDYEQWQKIYTFIKENL